MNKRIEYALSHQRYITGGIISVWQWNGKNNVPKKLCSSQQLLTWATDEAGDLRLRNLSLDDSGQFLIAGFVPSSPTEGRKGQISFYLYNNLNYTSCKW